ncbi:hypothetical protein AB1Y20_013018 [Prymnesium parvum]|uniref:Uncharacterized protein n=1 Tax=Prymnesium parvum TaxID=97485 RepID=A0AB34IK15_PRYPA
MPTASPAAFMRAPTLDCGVPSFGTPSAGMFGRSWKGSQRTSTSCGDSAIALSRLRLPTQHQGHMMSLATETITLERG